MMGSIFLEQYFTNENNDFHNVDEQFVLDVQYEDDLVTNDEEYPEHQQKLYVHKFYKPKENVLVHEF